MAYGKMAYIKIAYIKMAYSIISVQKNGHRTFILDFKIPSNAQNSMILTEFSSNLAMH